MWVINNVTPEELSIAAESIVNNYTPQEQEQIMRGSEKSLLLSSIKSRINAIIRKKIKKRQHFYSY